MKGLLDIQQDIRNLETNLKDVTERLKSIHSDIEEIKNSSDTAELDYEQIEILAGQFSFGRHFLGKMDAGICKIYLEMLLNIVHLDLETEMVVNRLVFIQWLKNESGLEWSLEDLYKDSLKMNRDAYYEFSAVPPKYRESFLVDALIVANMGGKANREILEYIADLSVIFGISKDDLRTLSGIAKIILCQNINDIGRTNLVNLRKHIKNYKHYIWSGFDKEVIIALRDVAVELKDEEVDEFKWKVTNGSVVCEGELVAIYCKVTKRIPGHVWRNQYNIKATSSGKIFQFRDNNTNYGVIADENDNKESIKAWIKANRRK